MGRPLTEFIFAQTLPWSHGLTGDARDDVDTKILSLDSDTGELTAVVRYPAGWSRPEPEALSAEEEMYVLDGSITINGHTYTRDSYMCLPKHYKRAAAISEKGCVALTFFDATPTESEPGARHDPKAPLVEGLNVYDMRWDSKVADPSLEWMGNRRKVLRMDPVHNQKATFIISTPPHIYPENWACPTLTHPCAEEAFMLSGDMVGPHGRMTSGAYFWRPAQIAHGPFGTRDGGMSLIRFRHGPHVNVWGDAQTPFSYNSKYNPVVPQSLTAYAKTYEGPARYEGIILPQIAFFPWLRINDDIRVGRYSLLKFDRADDLGERSLLDFNSLKSLFGMYRRFTADMPCDSLALLTIDDKKIGDEFSQEEIGLLFSFSQLLAFSALSSRRYFAQSINYCSRDNINLVIQNLPTLTFNGSIVKNSRRRDGWSNTLITKSDYFELIPTHAGQNYQLEFDDKLLISLIRAYEALDDDRWTPISESISLFNLSNTDSDAIPRQSEIIFLYCAFERLIGANQNLSDFENQLVKLFQPKTEETVPAPADNADLHGDFCAENINKRIISSWIKGFYVARGNMAHGKLSAHPNKFLPIQNHLLLGTFLFPIICKRVLANKGFYEWSARDQAYTDAFEQLVVFDHFKRPEITEKTTMGRDNLESRGESLERKP